MVTPRQCWFGLPTQSNPNLIEMAFAESTGSFVSTHEGRYFALPTNTHSRSMQLAGALESRFVCIAQKGSTTILWDARVNVLDYDEFHNVLEMAVPTVSVDATMYLRRAVKNHLSIVHADGTRLSAEPCVLCGADPVIGIFKSFSELFWQRGDPG